MPVQGRKPLEQYSTMDSSQSSSPSFSSGDRRAAPDSPRATRNRSASPKKPSPSKLYPSDELSRASKEFESVYTRRSAEPIYPGIDREELENENGYDGTRLRRGYESAQTSDRFVEEQETFGDGRGDYESRTPQRSPQIPVRPARKNKPTAKLGSIDGGRNDQQAEAEGLDHSPLVWTLVGAVVITLIISIFFGPYIPSWWNWYTTPTADEVNIQKFHNGMVQLERDFKEEVHPESFHLLRNALEHHVQTMSDTRRTYPTCVLIAGDRAGSETLNCLASRIAAIIPPSSNTKATPDKNVHVVNLNDDHHEHKNPDTEDRRSRVHTGINEGISEGAKIILFQNLESLIPDDIPLLQLFYSYCDGENPTFPKTLWLLTVGTNNLTYLEGLENEHHQPGFVKSVKRKVENYLEKILKMDKPKPEGEIAEETVTITRNPILTRIANYIVPVLKSTQNRGQCKGSGRHMEFMP